MSNEDKKIDPLTDEEIQWLRYFIDYWDNYTVQSRPKRKSTQLRNPD